jgi:NADH-quinone oxidoreductase subunit J
MVQIIVYAGAIMVLFLFVIMYLNLGRDVEGGIQILFRRLVGWLIGAVLLVLGVMLVGRQWFLGPTASVPIDPSVGNTQALGQVLYTRYLFPFEVTSIVLLVAMVGAVVIARGRLGPARQQRAKAAAAPVTAPVVSAPAPAVAPRLEPSAQPVGAGSGAGGAS